MSLLKISLLVLSILSFSSIKAADYDTLKVISNSSSIKVNPYTNVYYTNLKLNGIQAWNLIQSEKLEPSAYNTNPGINYPNAAFWMVMNIQNQSGNNMEAYLELDYPQMDQVSLYHVQNGSPIVEYETGDNFRFIERPVIYRNYLFPITLEKDQTITLLFNFDKRNSIVRFPIFFHQKSEFEKTMVQEQWIHGLYFGLILFVALVASVLGWTLSSNLFLRYSFYVLAFGLWLFTRLGYSYQYLIGEFPELNLHLVPLTTVFGTIALILYIQSFFETRKYLKRFHQAMNGVLTFFVAGLTFWLLFPDKMIEMGNLMLNIRYVITMLVVVFTFVSAFRFYRIDKFRTLIFFSAYTFLLLAILSKIMAEYSLTDESSFLFDPLMVGFLIEILVLSVAMALILKRILSQRQELKLETEHLKGSLSNAQKILSTSESGLLTLRSKAVLSLEDIRYIKSDDHYLEFYIDDRKRPEIDRESMSSIKKILPTYFQQIHRSTILNLRYIKSIYADKVVLKDETELRLSRRYKEQLQKQFIKSQN